MIWQIKPIELKLKYTWKLSRNSSDFKINYIITVIENNLTAQGEVAPNIRYLETPEKINEQFSAFINYTQSHPINTLDDLNLVLNSLNPCSALRFGIESAYIHLLCKKQNITLYQFLNIPQNIDIKTCYTLPIMDIGLIQKFYHEYHLNRFETIKIKVNSESGLEEIHELSKLTKNPIMVDANEAWNDPDKLLVFMEKLNPYPIAFIEQPMPSHMVDAYEYIKPQSKYILMADESCLSDVNLIQLKKQFNGINMKLMKAGGYINGLKTLNEAKKLGFITMTGCMVETTLGIKGAHTLASICDYADLDGYMIIEKEPFELLYEENGIVRDK